MRDEQDEDRIDEVAEKTKCQSPQPISLLFLRSLQGLGIAVALPAKCCDVVNMTHKSHSRQETDLVQIDG